ncbi:UNVERIFIED_CONTAM: hypothetical protein K2H54_033250, partial [Gekko kuhli]
MGRSGGLGWKRQRRLASSAAERFEKKYNAELSSGNVSKGTKFEYAWCLVRSKYNEDIKKGIVLLEDLLPKGNKEEQRDYVFYLAVANYRLKIRTRIPGSGRVAVVQGMGARACGEPVGSLWRDRQQSCLNVGGQGGNSQVTLAKPPSLMEEMQLWQAFREYEKALKYIRGLLKTEPTNTQALELEKLINKAMQK